MSAISFSNLDNKSTNLTITKPREIGEINLLTAIENKIAASEGGLNAFAAKSFRSARYTLVKRLAGRSSKILSFQSESDWEKEENAYQRLGVEIVFTKNYPERTLTDILYNENISVVYLNTIDKKSLKVENFISILKSAQDHNVPVVFDNSSGFLGAIFKPLAENADFVIDNVEGFNVFRNTRIGAFIVEGKQLFGNLPEHESSFLETLKVNRTAFTKQRFLPVAPKNQIDNIFNQERSRYQLFSDATFAVARWINQSPLVAQVEYPGVAGGNSYANAQAHFTGGYGNVLKFSVHNNEFGFSFLRSSFIVGLPEGVKILTDKENRTFRIEINQDNSALVLEYFQRVLNQLQKELDFKKAFKKRLSIERALNAVLKRMAF